MTAHQEFRDNPAIAALAESPRWTVSTKEKMPIDFVKLIQSFTGQLPIDQKAIQGAVHRDHRCLVPLDSIFHWLPDAANHTFLIDASIDGLAVLDIESSCPPEIRDDITFRIAPLMLAESMSGHGRHLLLKLPENFDDFPIAAEKPVLKHPEGHYEILLKHYVTFTSRMLPITTSPVAGAWEELYAELASIAKPTPKAEFDVSEQMPEIPHCEKILSKMMGLSASITTTAEDFGHDMSRYEFSVMGSVTTQAFYVLDIYQRMYQNRYTDEQIAWMIYLVSREVLPHRSKHDTLRNGLPLLLANAVNLVALRRGAEAEDQKTIQAETPTDKHAVSTAIKT